jgi:hypothetical protein
MNKILATVIFILGVFALSFFVGQGSKENSVLKSQKTILLQIDSKTQEKLLQK